MDREVPEAGPEMRMIAALLALLLFASHRGPWRQHDADGVAPARPRGCGPGAAQDGATSWFPRTLAQDISTASYYELVAWCDQLGLDDSGSRKDLQARLAAHFYVTLPTRPVARASGHRPLGAEVRVLHPESSKEKYLPAG